MSVDSLRGALVGGVVAALLVLMLPSGARSGDGLVLGMVNRASEPTWLISRSSSTLKLRNGGVGPALDLLTQEGVAPLRVNQNDRVDNLNADMVDGAHASDLLGAKSYDNDRDLRVDVAEEADTLDGKHAISFLPRLGKARDSLRADDAGTLGGFAPNGLIRVTQDNTRNARDANGYAVDATITAPTPGWLVMSGSIDASVAIGEFDLYRCELHVNGTKVVGSQRISHLDAKTTVGNLNAEENCATDGVVSVAAGTHTVGLYVYRAGGKAAFGEAAVWALFVPFNGQGNQYVP